jgi:hypothetical protein
MSVSSRLFVAVAGLSLCLVHCSISNAGGGPDISDASGDANRPADGASGDAPGDDSSSADANPPPDGADGATADGNTVDGNDSSAPATDAADDGSADAATCRSIAQECADAATADLGCGTTWSAAQQPSTWCSRVPNARVYTAPQCDGFDIVVLGGNDASSFYYYDPQTGALVGIEKRGNNGPTCVAGLAPDVPLTDCYDAGGVSIVTCEADGSFTD